MSQSSSSGYDPAQYYDGYYASLVSWTDGEDLKQQLHSIISGGTYQPITYAGTYTNWYSNKEADKSFTDREKVDALYSDDDIMASETNVSWQREHVWPASLMTGSTTGNAVKFLGRATDFHNLFAGGTSGNTSRGNKNYGVADKNASSYVNKMGNGGGYAYDSTYFEPGDKDKGRASRAIFYMATMYCEEVFDSVNNVTMKPLTIVEENVPYTESNPKFAIGGFSTLLEWSKRPVDYLEYQHNVSVYSYVPPVHSDPANNVAQGNRNPYVDYPELVEYAFGEKKDQPGRLSDLKPTYEALEMDDPTGVISYAIETAKRTYSVGDTLSKADLKVIEIRNDFSSREINSFSLIPADGSVLDTVGKKTVTVDLPVATLKYEIDVKNTYVWSYKVVKADFTPILTKANTVNEVTLGGMDWTIWWNQGAIASSMSREGVKFGTSATATQVTQLIFETKQDFGWDGCSIVDAIAIEAAPSSGQTCQIKYYVGGTLIGTKTMTYDSKAILEFKQSLSTPKTGKVKIEIINTAKPFIVKNLAVSAH